MFFFFCVVFAMRLYMFVYMCIVVTCWERADLLALLCGVLLYVCYFPIGILGQVWYLIVLIPDLCTLTYRLRAKKGPAPPPLGNFADISYLNENFKPHLLRDVCTLCSGALVSDSLLHMLL